MRQALRRMAVTSLLAAAVSLLPGSSGTLRAEPPRPFVFTAIPDEDETRLRERFDQVADYLARTLGVPVRYVPVKSYPAAVTAFTNDQVQLAWFGGLTGVQARLAVPGSHAIAQGVEDREFVTYFIANQATGLKSSETFPAAIAGRTFTFGAKSSTSGRLMPEFYIRKHLGKAPEDVFRRVGFSEDHSRTIALVQSGAYEVGAVNFKVWENEVAAGNADPVKVVVVWKTPPYPDYNWSVRGDVDSVWGPGFSKRLADALIGMKDPKLLAAFPRKGFIPATDAEYRPILETARAIGLLE
jgi:phosphonate transport system substrate-binding protein